MTVVARLRRLFDLDAHPTAIAAHLAATRAWPRTCGPTGAARGRSLRSVRSGDQGRAGPAGQRRRGPHIAGRLAARLGQAIATPHAGLSKVYPPAAVVAGARPRTWPRCWGSRCVGRPR